MVWLLAMLFIAQQASAQLETIARGEFSHTADTKAAVVCTATEWVALWQLHDPSRPLPRIDFSSRTVGGIFLGTPPTGGFRAEITATRREGDILIAEYTETGPDSGDIVTQVLTSPFHIVAVPGHDGPIRFEKLSATRQR